MLGYDIPESEKTVLGWSNILPGKTIAIFLTQYWIICSGALRETIGIYDMHNACRLWHIITNYTVNDSKDRGQVVTSLPIHNENAYF